jgi:hypothetical protein
MSNANGAKRVSLSLAAFVLICFFLPWVQAGCGTLKDSISGFEIARETDSLLWLIPAFMILIIIFGLASFLSESVRAVYALTNTVGGSISAYLMYREQSMMTDSPRLVAIQWTPFFWLGFIACLGIVVSAFVFYAQKSRSP